MLILPLGPEDNEVRRHPVVTYALIAVNVLVHVVTVLPFQEEPWALEMNAKLDEIVAYLGEHPELPPPPDLLALLPADLARELRRNAGGGGTPAPAEARAEAEGARLESMVNELKAIRDRSPWHRFGFIPRERRLTTWITSDFVHGDLFHLVGNMFFLYVSGPFVEDVFGRGLFTAIYLMAGLAGTAGQLLNFPDSAVPNVGASGAIAGVMGAFLVRLWSQKIRFLVIGRFFYRFYHTTFRVPAWIVLPVWFLEQSLAAEASGDGGGVGYWAHVGGFILGAFGAVLVKIFFIEEHFIHPAIEAEIGIVRSAAFTAALEARDRREWAEAREAIAEALAEAPQDVDTVSLAYDIALGSGDDARAAGLAVNLLELHVAAGEDDLALQLLREAPARLGTKASGSFVAQGRAYLHQIGRDDLVRELRPDTSGARGGRELLDLYEEAKALADAGRGQEARTVCDRILAHPACTDAWRESVARLRRSTRASDGDTLA